MFEPDPKDPAKTTSHVATCGGNSICIIDVNSGTVLMKYKHKDIKENFYTLAWYGYLALVVTFSIVSCVGPP